MRQNINLIHCNGTNPAIDPGEYSPNGNGAHLSETEMDAARLEKTKNVKVERRIGEFNAVDVYAAGREMAVQDMNDEELHAMMRAFGRTLKKDYNEDLLKFLAMEAEVKKRRLDKNVDGTDITLGNLIALEGLTKSIVDPNTGALVPEELATWEFLDASMLTPDEFTPTQWAVEGVFKTPSLNLIVGTPGGGKTLLAVDLAVSLACLQAEGKEGNWPAPHPNTEGNSREEIVSFRAEGRNVFILDLDNGKDVMQERIGAAIRARRLPPVDVPLRAVSLPSPWPYLMQRVGGSAREDITWYNRFLMLCKNNDIGLLVIDNLNTIAGDVDENSAEMGKALTMLRRLSSDANVAIVVVHHTRKGNGLTQDDPGDAIRGSTSIKAAVDTALLVTTKEEGIYYVQQAKARKSAIPSFCIQLSYEWWENSRDFKEYRLWSIPMSDRKSREKYEVLVYAKRVLKENGPMKKTELRNLIIQHADADGVKKKIGGRDKVDFSLTQLKNEGELVVTEGEKNANFFALRLEDTE